MEVVVRYEVGERSKDWLIFREGDLCFGLEM